jgi:putative restriction endonuclease
LPVRVIRGAGGDPAYAPASGYRYDGLYRVDDHWSEVGKSRCRIWRYRLVRLPAGGHSLRPADQPAQWQWHPASNSGVTQRTVRSTAVAEAIKKLYEHACQVCDLQLEVPGGYYSEGAHIRALGRPHSGPDVPENVLCLCPNHHALFDDGGIYITDDFKGATIVTRSSAL